MANSELFKDLTACFQAAVGAYHTTEMRSVESYRKDRGVITCAAELFEQTTGQKSIEITPSQEKTLKRSLLVAAGPAGKNPWMGGVDAGDIVEARDAIFNNALKAGLIKRAPKA
jgi:hypothetical protein